MQPECIRGSELLPYSPDHVQEKEYGHHHFRRHAEQRGFRQAGSQAHQTEVYAVFEQAEPDHRLDSVAACQHRLQAQRENRGRYRQIRSEHIELPHRGWRQKGGSSVGEMEETPHQ